VGMEKYIPRFVVFSYDRSQLPDSALGRDGPGQCLALTTRRGNDRPGRLPKEEGE
jgi:hypothetical protein